jgi:hypothetical protein
VTGYSGVVTGIVAYITGCNQCLVTPPIDKHGKPQDSHWIDVQRLDVNTKNKPIILENVMTPGCGPEAPKR